jgi:neutral ceramidase
MLLYVIGGHQIATGTKLAKVRRFMRSGTFRLEAFRAHATLFRRPIGLAAIAAALACVAAVPTSAAALRAGVGKVVITSTPDEFPYTAPRERPYVGIHDDVYSRALVLDDGKRRIALVVVEVTKLPDPSGLVKQVAQELGVPETNVLIAASHTHNVPLVFFHEKEPNDLQKREIQRLTQGTLEAVRQAKAGLQPARIAFGRGQAWVNVNNGEQSGSKPYDPNGPSDKTLDVVKITKADGTALALLVNYAAHAEVMFRSATKDGGYEVSGDLPGAVSRLLEAQPGAAPMVLYSPAAEGDQVTLYKSLLPPGRLPGADEGAGGWSLLSVQARRVADSVMGVLSNIPAGSAQAHIEAAATQVTCPGQQMHRDQNSGQITTEDAPPVSIPLSMIRINDIVLAGVGGDVASAIGQQFKATSPVPQSTFISMANGSLGYLLTDASYEHPDHGVMGSPLKPHCAESAIVDGLVRLIKSGS